MSRTAAGLVDVARRLTGPIPGIRHAVAQSPRRFATGAFERLGGDCHDLDMLERALDQLPGLRGAEESTGSRELRRRRAPQRAVASSGAVAAPPGNGSVRSSDRIVTDQPRAREEGRRGSPNSAPPSWPERPRHGGPIAAPGSTIELPDGLRQRSAGAGPRPGDETEGSRGTGNVPARASELDWGGYESESRLPPADSVDPPPPQGAEPFGPAWADRAIANGVTRPAYEAAPTVPTGFSGALGDLLRRSGVRELPSPAALTPTNRGTVRPPRSAPPEVMHASGAPPVAMGVPTAAAVVEAFEMAMDELVRREAERHGLESEL